MPARSWCTPQTLASILMQGIYSMLCWAGAESNLSTACAADTVAPASCMPVAGADPTLQCQCDAISPKLDTTTTYQHTPFIVTPTGTVTPPRVGVHTGSLKCVCTLQPYNATHVLLLLCLKALQDDCREQVEHDD